MKYDNVTGKPVEPVQHGKLFTWIYLLLVVLFYGFGLFSTVAVLFGDTAVSELLRAIIRYITPFITTDVVINLLQSVAILTVLVIVIGLVVVYLIRFFAYEVTLISYYFLIFIFLGLTILSFLTNIILAIFFFILFVILVIGHPKARRYIKITGNFIEFAAKLVTQEKMLLLLPLVIGIFTVISVFFMIFSAIEIFILFPANSDGTINSYATLLFIAGEFIFVLLYAGLYFLLQSIMVSYAYDWYRGKDPNLRTALKDVRQAAPIILKLAFITATIQNIIAIFRFIASFNQLSKKESKGSNGNFILQLITIVIFLFALAIVNTLGRLLTFMTPYTLPAIVVKKKSLTDSIKESAEYIWVTFVDYVAGGSGFGTVMAIFTIINIILWFFIGQFFASDWVASGLISSDTAAFVVLIFVLFSFISYQVLVMPIKVAFHTFMYSYAMDIMTDMKYPSKFPEIFINEFDMLITIGRDVDRRRMFPRTPYWL
jgi:hypothetical protein